MTSKQYYEAHITFTCNTDGYIPQYKSWTFSKIDGDPVLGEGVKCYLTKHFKSSKSLKSIIEEMDLIKVNMDLFMINVKWLRSKVELVVYDTKTMHQSIGKD